MPKSSSKAVVPQTMNIAELPERARGWLQTLNREAAQHPFRTVGIATGAGFVLGGGLFTPLAARTLRSALFLGLRVGILPALARGFGINVQWNNDESERDSSTSAEGNKP